MFNLINSRTPWIQIGTSPSLFFGNQMLLQSVQYRLHSTIPAGQNSLEQLVSSIIADDYRTLHDPIIGHFESSHPSIFPFKPNISCIESRGGKRYNAEVIRLQPDFLLVI
ncbi:unnamed protein product [Aspergillus oryzae RIB40]|uniref:DNA, SC020 n=2 Tax=Aspergillus oryzae TaxID=5062 RepID=Q2U4U8_ASPOR|nr:unnamed protein product [Aspergillus oryzae RIB40]EIT77826.1 hypothetical protein Ao3042_05822 [Aspergillus oryzae 3.042]KDE79618.1 hypothetical protein AO1008_06127 [Aspergillus oryzae 100-8]BAE63417.1 unnamed protein product [Aspergillus oryzae RIB40]|eukprot:EIT77826.1 hypothetical protein Ao3042_05822 [Aspergillus oryzae 3.042]